MKLFSSTVLLVLVAAVAMSTDVLAAPLEARSITYGRNPVQHLYRDGAYYRSKDYGKTWKFIGCEPEPKEQVRIAKGQPSVGVPMTQKRVKGIIRTSCDGGITWH
jgi:hypothetical protein